MYYLCNIKQRQKQNAMKTQSAQAAKEIKKELKNRFPHVKFSVTSDNFANGDAVRIHYQDGPATEEIEKITDKYQEGHFDGMTDMYEYSNSREDIPQAKYVTVSREMSEKSEALALEILAVDFGITDDASCQEKLHCWLSQATWRLFCESL